MYRRKVLLGASALLLSACSGNWKVSYKEGVSSDLSRDWTVTHVSVRVPESLTVSNEDSYAPDADIVWHGEPYGDRRAQVRAIVDEGITKGTEVLSGDRPVTLAVELRHFHSVTPTALANAPGAVHNIRYVLQVYDNETKRPLTRPELVNADLEAFVGAAAVTAALEGNTQRVRIVNHLARVTAGWLGAGPDQRRTFAGFGR